jgi:tRNA(Ile)-lysidine synthase
MDAETLANELPALRGRVLRRWWTEEGPERKEHTLSSAQTEALDSLLGQSRGKINLPGGRYAVRSGKHLFLCGGEAPPPEPETITGAETVFGGYRLTESVSAGDPGDGKKTQEVPADFTRGCVIRTRRPGDRIRPFGSAGSRKLQDYLTDRRIAEPFRDRIPLVCRGQEVLLVCGVGAGNIPEWHSLTAPVRLTWQGDMPWMDK